MYRDCFHAAVVLVLCKDFLSKSALGNFVKQSIQNIHQFFGQITDSADKKIEYHE